METQPQQPTELSPEVEAIDEKTQVNYRKKFTLMISLAMVVAIIFTAVALELYNNGVASQLDLSRPGFEQVRSEIDQTEVATFDGTGVLTEETVAEFQKLYGEELSKTKTNQYTSDTLTDEALGMTAVPEKN
ncbi:hypothetical protein EOL96_09755 [Candidatus Saccharibacteria bacterium]|nr:hypothetical protein [Candidatus Saccharibacteria bacterium]